MQSFKQKWNDLRNDHSTTELSRYGIYIHSINFFFLIQEKESFTAYKSNL